MPTKKEEIVDNTLIVKKSDDYQKSKVLISSKYKSTLIENKLLDISLSKAKEFKAETVSIGGDEVKVFTSEINSSELTKLLKIDSKNLSSVLKKAYIRMASTQIGMEDENGQFMYRNLFIGGDYVNGVLKLYYNPLLGSYYKNFEAGSYTTLSLNQLMKFKSVFTYRLYSILKQDCYISGKNKNLNTIDKKNFVIEYSLSELKLMLGTVDSSSTAVRSVLDGKKPDYDKAVEYSKDKTFESWREFKRNCVDVAVNEISASTEMDVSYTTHRVGKGGKIVGLTFYVCIEKKEAFDVIPTIPAPSEEDMYELMINLSYLFGAYDLKVKELKSIALASGYDLEKCKKAKNVLDNTKNISNVVGFVIKAIENDYEVPKSFGESSFCVFEEQDYDFEELEKLGKKQ